MGRKHSATTATTVKIRMCTEHRRRLEFIAGAANTTIDNAVCTALSNWFVMGAAAQTELKGQKRTLHPNVYLWHDFYYENPSTQGTIAGHEATHGYFGIGDDPGNATPTGDFRSLFPGFSGASFDDYLENDCHDE